MNCKPSHPVFQGRVAAASPAVGEISLANGPLPGRNIDVVGRAYIMPIIAWWLFYVLVDCAPDLRRTATLL